MFTQLEAERDTLRSKVEQLRSFESSYRSTLTSHLQSQLRAIGETQFAPSQTPAVLSEPQASGSATPRLDALLGEGH